MYSLLTDDLQCDIEIDGYVYEINTGFKAVLKAVAAIDSIGQPPKATSDAKTISAYYAKLNEKINQVLYLIYGQRTHNPSEALKKAVEFIQFDRDNGNVEEESEKSFDFTTDSKYIYSAFLQQYNIDLTVTDVHWWKFKALLQSLKECKLTDVIYYRTLDLSEYQGRELRRMQKLKDMYSLSNERHIKQNPSQILREFLKQRK